MDEKQGSDPSAIISVHIGAQVVTADGEELGRISRVRGDQFKIDVRTGRDFWLDKHTVLTASEEQTQLAYDSVQLEGFKLATPGVTAESPEMADRLETFSSEKEQAQHRRAMERGHG